MKSASTGTPTGTKRTAAAVTAAIAAAGLTLAGCETVDLQDEQTQRAIGAAIGAGGGYLACKTTNADTTQCALLVLAGAAAGYVIAGRINQNDAGTRNQAVADVLEGQNRAGAVSNYTVPGTGASGSLTLANVAAGPCKTIEELYMPSGATPIKETYTMCKRDDGKWANAS